MAACENMIDARATRPGDVLTAANGKTVEVNNTDAEVGHSPASATYQLFNIIWTVEVNNTDAKERRTPARVPGGTGVRHLIVQSCSQQPRPSRSNNTNVEMRHSVHTATTSTDSWKPLGS